MAGYSIEPTTTKYIKRYRFLPLAIYLFGKYGEKLLDTPTKTRLDTTKTASKKVVYKTAEATQEFIGNKIIKKIVKPKPVPYKNSRNVDEIVSPLEKRQEILNASRQVL